MMTPDPVSGLPRETSLGYQVNHLARLFAKALAQRIAPFGVVPGQFAALLALYEQDGISQQELSELVRIEQPTMAATLKRMERDGLVSRDADPADRRRQIIVLTPHARRLEPELVAAAREINATAVRGLDDAEAAQLLALIRRVIAALEADTR